VLYEVHVGAYTPEGTFDALAAELPEIKRLGVNALQIMPVAEFPGQRGWGYDGVDLYAPSRHYGGPEGLRRLVDAAHGLGLAVMLDVVYNHLGPDGNYLRAYSPDYFTSRYTTPWGEALNFDGEGAWGAREIVIQNACYWLNEFHIDGLRLDATHAIFDLSQRHILQRLASRARASVPPDRRVVLLAEDSRNDVRFLRPADEGGHGLDMVYADDFHHEVRVLLTGERGGYYLDYEGRAERIARTIGEGFLYQGQHSEYAGGPRGTKTTDEPAWQFLFALQNHDQVGNRAFGERLHHMVDARRYAAASALLLLAPETPSLFMGQEFAASAPFLYFTDHEPALGRLVTQGRRREFARFRAFSDPEARERIPDPQAEDTFLRSKLDLSERGRHAGTYRLYRDLLALRQSDPVFRRQDRQSLRAGALGREMVILHRWAGDDFRTVLVNLGESTPVYLGASEGASGLPAELRHLLWSSLSPAYDTGEPPFPIGAELPERFEMPGRCALVLGPKAALPQAP
jgi:maltooligosyltrehalose trehalohydrolase